MTYETDSIFWVELEKIVPNPYQPRREFDESKLRELGESIRMYGLLQPLTVTRREVMSEDGSFRSEYELIAGERRLRAAKLMGLGQVPVIIRSDEQSEMMKLELAIIENLQREDLNPVDRARAFKQLMDQFGLSHTQIAKKMGRSREYVSNSVRLLQLPETILSALQSGDISDGHARTLLMLNGKEEEQDILFREILLKKLSVREVERLARKVATDKVRKKNWDVDPQVIAMEKKLTESLGTRVQISKTDYGGKLVIDYFSTEDLEKLLKRMGDAEQESAPAEDDDFAAVAAATPLEETSPEDTDEAVESTSQPEAQPAQHEEMRHEENGGTTESASQLEAQFAPDEEAPHEESDAPNVVPPELTPAPNINEEKVPSYFDQNSTLSQDTPGSAVVPDEPQRDEQRDAGSTYTHPLSAHQDAQRAPEAPFSPDTPSEDDKEMSREEGSVGTFAHAASEPVTEKSEESKEVDVPKQEKEDEDELYSIKNFSL